MKTEHTASPKLFIGIDIHKRSRKIHGSTHISGVKTFSMFPSPKGLINYVDRHFSEWEVTTAYEAGCCGYYAHLLRAMGDVLW